MIAAVLLVASLLGVILPAKVLTPTVERAVLGAGLPDAFLGVVIAAPIPLPEALASLCFAAANRRQTGLNAALCSAQASIALTIPVFAVAALLLDWPLVLGPGPEGMTLLIVMLFTSSLTLATIHFASMPVTALWLIGLLLGLSLIAEGVTVGALVWVAGRSA